MCLKEKQLKKFEKKEIPTPKFEDSGRSALFCFAIVQVIRYETDKMKAAKGT